MVMQIVPMAMMSIKIAPGDLALKMISPVIMDCVSHAGTGVTGTMTVVTTVMRGTAHTPPAVRLSLPVRMGSALIRPMSVMGKMTVEITQMSRSTCATSQKPRAHLISSSVTMVTALRW